MAFRFKNAIFGARRSGRQKIEKKILLLEVLALKVPFRNLLVVSESSPVAGTIVGSNPTQSLDAGRARELQKSAQPATHMLSVNCLYQMNPEKRKREFVKRTTLLIWSPEGARKGHLRPLHGQLREDE